MGQASGAVFDQRRGVEQLPDAPGRGAGVGEGLHYPANAFDAKHQGGGNQQRGHQFTDADPALGHQLCADHQNPHVAQRDHRLRQRNPRAGPAQRCAGQPGKLADLGGEAVDTLLLQAERLDHPHRADTFGEVLVDPVVGGADRAVQLHQTLGLQHEDVQAEQGQQQRAEGQQRVIPGQQADGGDHHQRGFHQLPPEAHQRIADLVGVAGGAGDDLAHAVLPVVAQVQAQHLFEDAFAQAREQRLAEDQRAQCRSVLQHGAAEGDGEDQPEPVPGHPAIEAAVGLLPDGHAGGDVVEGVADQPLLPDQPQVDENEQPGDQGETPGHFAVDRQAAQQRVSMAHEELEAG